MQYRLLIVDDDVNSAKTLARILAAQGYAPDYVSSAEEALALLQEVDYDLFIVDMVLPGMDGLEFLKHAKQINQDILAVIITAYGSITTAVNALKSGASDFLEKPVIPEKLLHVLHRIFEERQLKREVIALRADLLQRYRFENLIGKHPKMRGIFNIIESLSAMDSSVLITGETGTGKDLVARAIHFHSHRKTGPFVAINCAAVPESLLESELFGYERGAFTGAERRKHGKLEQANGGTLFLDEIADMPYSLQSKLLRTIQDKKIERLGGNQLISLNFRIIAATNKDLTQELTSNRFRLDLYYRINVVPIHLPPLRERLEDIPLLADHLLEKLARANSRPKPKLSQRTMFGLMKHSWPGNVRELENVLERAMILAQDDLIDDVPISLSPVRTPAASGGTPFELPPNIPFKVAKDQALAVVEKQYFTQLLRKNKGSVSLTAADAQVDARTVLRKMKQFGLVRSDFK
ncbi:MAG TPA: sigma-54 dependent transcriptional regulator [Desulfomonilaceae bacterium]|nr:sigma-54 dependent transcriptional regulator [Desulfomonilaceae bacterium]